MQAIVDAAISKKPKLDITGKELSQQIALYVSIDSYKKIVYVGVKMILQMYYENGNNQLCQRWQTVFSLSAQC